jgi:hypothetical protein
MAIRVEATPNPNALKFTVGQDVGEPKTYVSGGEEGDPLARDLLALDGVTSIFMTADFVTLSKTPEADWSLIAPQAEEILERHFGG